MSETYDVFISYWHGDKDWVQTLANNLHQLNLEVFFDEWEIAPGDKLTIKLGEAIRTARNGIMVISPQTLERPWIMEEYAAMLTRTVAGKMNLIPVILHNAELPPFLASRLWVDFRGVYGDTYLQKVTELAAYLKGKRKKRPPRTGVLTAPSAPPQPIKPGNNDTSKTRAKVITEDIKAPKSDARTLKILHLSDFHFRDGTSWDANPVLNRMADDVKRLGDEDHKPDLIVITGDIAFSGKKTEYQLAEKWILEKLLPKSGLDKDRLLVVPGNHDVDRSSIALAAKYIQDGLLAGQDQQQVAEVFEEEDHFFHRQSEFIKFLNRLNVAGQQWTKSWGEVELNINSVKIHFAGMNSAWLSHTDHEQGKLLLGLWQCNTLLKGADKSDLVIAAMHHPFSYFPEWDDQAQTEIERTVRDVEKNRFFLLCRIFIHIQGGQQGVIFRIYDGWTTMKRDKKTSRKEDLFFSTSLRLLLRGHLHSPRYDLYTNPNHRGIVQLAAGAAYETSKYPNSYHLVEVSPSRGKARIFPRFWNQHKRNWAPDFNVFEAESGELNMVF